MSFMKVCQHSPSIQQLLLLYPETLFKTGQSVSLYNVNSVALTQTQNHCNARKNPSPTEGLQEIPCKVHNKLLTLWNSALN